VHVCWKLWQLVGSRQSYCHIHQANQSGLFLAHPVYRLWLTYRVGQNLVALQLLKVSIQKMMQMMMLCSVISVLCKLHHFALQFYGYLSQQQNMMQDYIRTSTYQRAMLENAVDFQDKVPRFYNYSSFFHISARMIVMSLLTLCSRQLLSYFYDILHAHIWAVLTGVLGLVDLEPCLLFFSLSTSVLSCGSFFGVYFLAVLLGPFCLVTGFLIWVCAVTSSDYWSIICQACWFAAIHCE